MSSYRYSRYAGQARASVRGTSNGLYRIPEEGVILGVCAGIADHFGLFTWIVRIIAIVLLCMLTFPVIVAYLLLGILLPERPLRYAGDPDSERAFWRRRDDHGGVAS